MPLTGNLIISFIINSPISILTGYLFTNSCKQIQDKNKSIGNVYIIGRKSKVHALIGKNLQNIGIKHAKRPSLAGTKQRPLWVIKRSQLRRSFYCCMHSLQEGLIPFCYVTGTVSAGTQSYNLGVLVGDNFGNIIDCYATGNITVGNYSAFIGGLVGSNLWGSITTCYAITSISYYDKSLDVIGG